MTNLRTNDRSLAYVLLRVAVGVNFLGHGTIRLLRGDANFAAGMVKQMADTPLPAAFVHAFGLAIPFIEFTLGLLLLVGLFTRWTLIAASLLMISLMVGITLKQDWPTAGLQLIYCFLLALLLFLREPYEASWISLLLLRTPPDIQS